MGATISLYTKHVTIWRCPIPLYYCTLSQVPYPSQKSQIHACIFAQTKCWKFVHLFEWKNNWAFCFELLLHCVRFIYMAKIKNSRGILHCKSTLLVMIIFDNCVPKCSSWWIDQTTGPFKSHLHLRVSHIYFKYGLINIFSSTVRWWRTAEI